MTPFDFRPRTRVLFGAGENPMVPPLEHRALRLAKKVAAGAQFIQTQYCYDVPLLRGFMEQIEALGLIGKVFILVGVGPLRSAKTAEWMRKNVPGMHVPDTVITRLAGAQDQGMSGFSHTKSLDSAAAGAAKTLYGA